ADVKRQAGRVVPFLYFAMSIGKRKPTSAVMIIGRPIAPRAFHVHPHQKISIINAFGMFIQEDEGLRRRWADDLEVLAVSKKPAVYLSGVPTIPVHIAIHGHAAHPWQGGTA